MRDIAVGDARVLRNALTWALFSPGLPVVYYGTEQGSYACGDGHVHSALSIPRRFISCNERPDLPRRYGRTPWVAIERWQRPRALGRELRKEPCFLDAPSLYRCRCHGAPQQRARSNVPCARPLRPSLSSAGFAQDDNRASLWPAYNTSSPIYSWLRAANGARKQLGIAADSTAEDILLANASVFAFARGEHLVVVTNGPKCGDVEGIRQELERHGAFGVLSRRALLLHAGRTQTRRADRMPSLAAPLWCLPATAIRRWSARLGPTCRLTDALGEWTTENTDLMRRHDESEDGIRQRAGGGCTDHVGFTLSGNGLCMVPLSRDWQQAAGCAMEPVVVSCAGA